MTKEKKILRLPLKKEWYDLIESGIKTEEYREIKPYWIKRLVSFSQWHMFNDASFLAKCQELGTDFNETNATEFTHVKFSYGYTRKTMMFRIESVTIGFGRSEWGAPGEYVFIIKFCQDD